MEIAALYDEHRPALRAIGYRMLGCAAEAEEVAQEAFVRLLQHRPDPDRPLRGWLVAVTVNLCRDRLRRGRSRLWLPGPLPGGAAWADDLDNPARTSPEARLSDRRRLSVAFLRAMEQLTPDQRAALVLQEVCGWSAAEIARALNTTPGNARVLHHRARRRLAEAETDILPQPPEQALVALQQFLGLVAAGDLAGAAACLAPGAVAISDGDGHNASYVPVTGALRIAKMYVWLSARTPAEIRLLTCNDQPALWVRFDGAPPRRSRRPFAACALLRVEVGPDGRIVRLESLLGDRRIGWLATSL